jgi:hypothetical protein
MAWTVEFHPAFEAEFDLLSRSVQTAIAARAQLIEEFGPQLGKAACRYPRSFKACKHERAALPGR